MATSFFMVGGEKVHILAVHVTCLTIPIPARNLVNVQLTSGEHVVSAHGARVCLS